MVMILKLPHGWNTEKSIGGFEQDSNLSSLSVHICQRLTKDWSMTG